ncbi:MAG: alpha/beta fold hydrolase [Actinomycetota bacterium]
MSPSSTSQSHPVVMIPSLGRPASDFLTIAPALEQAGFRLVLLDPRPHWHGSPTLHDLAADSLAQLDALKIRTFHLVGHAFGNRLARTIAADAPQRVATLALLAAGGLVEPPADVWAGLAKCFDLSLPPEQHLSEVRRVFFAHGNDASVWREGWMPEVSKYQRHAVQSTPRSDWWGASVDRVLVVQGLADVIAPPDNGRRYVAEFAPHARLVEIEGAGHALLPERPREIAAALLEHLTLA